MAAPVDPFAQARIVRLHERLAPHDGVAHSPLAGITIGCSSQPMARTPVLYGPSICFMFQGRKTCYLGNQAFVSDSHQYLVVSAPLPLEYETQATLSAPVRALVLNVDLAMLAELLLLLDQTGGSSSARPSGIFATPLSADLGDAVERLLQALGLPEDARILGPGIVREIFYRVLTGEQGDALRAALAYRGEFGQISRILRRIHEDCAAPIDVPTLARQAHMSPATFHTKFKAVTATSPIQYLKATRLHKARLLMLQDGLSAGAAALQVGYESVSQFSREFKRMFGRTPTEEMEQMRGLVAGPAPVAASV